MLLRDGISKKHKEIKNEFLRFCKGKATASIEADVTAIKRNLQNDMYGSIDEFNGELDSLKVKYNANAPVFTGKNEIISEISYQLLLKAADFLTISSKKETDVSIKKLKERCEELEKEKTEIKSEASLEKRMMEQKMGDLENEKN